MKIAHFLPKKLISSLFLPLCVTIILSACQSNEFTPEEIARQNAADADVSTILFAHELDNHASYNVHKDGSVVIKFDQSVNSPTYTSVVDELRATPTIKSVYAEQSGRQVCPLRSIR